MHRLFASLLLLSLGLQPSAAHALPGQTYHSLTQWVEQHSFLSPQLIGPIPLMDYWQVIASREVQDQVFIDVEYLFSDQDPLGTPNAVIREEALVAVERQPASDKSENELMLDPRPWRDVTYLSIWEPSNAKAEQVLTHLYGAKIAQDFKAAQLQFHGHEYVEESPTSYVRYPIERLRYRIYPWAKNIKIWVGQDYAYEVSGVSQAGNSPGKTSLKIRDKNTARTDIATLEHNGRMYQKYLQAAERVAPRSTPAALHLK